MKIYFYVTVFFLAVTSIAIAGHFWFGKTMSIAKAEKRWGKIEFDAKTFRSGEASVRSKMAASLVRNKRVWIGKHIREIRQELGSHDGFYFTDMIPAYLVELGNSKKEETWQVVFLPDANYLVEDIIIHKNCCD